MVPAKRRKSEDRIQTGRCIDSSNRIWFSFPALLSASASGGASRSGKHISGDGVNALPMGFYFFGCALAGSRFQTKCPAKGQPYLSRSVLVRRRIHCRHDYPLGMVAALTVGLLPKSFLRQAHCKKDLLTLYMGTRSSLGVQGGKHGSQTGRGLSLPRRAVRLRGYCDSQRESRLSRESEPALLLRQGNGQEVNRIG